MSGKLNGRPVLAISAKRCQTIPTDLPAGVLRLPANQNASRAKGARAFGRINQPGGHSSVLYLKLIVSRCSQGLLEPFRCAVCGIQALDPIGWNGPHKPLCGRCADPVEQGGE